MKLGPAKLNAAASYLNFAVMAALGLLINPLLVAHLGPSSFGVWKSCQRLLDFATVADGRATQALKWIVAHRMSASDQEAKQRDLGAALVVWAVWLPFLLIAVAGIVIALPFAINGISHAEMNIAQLAGGILAANIVMTGLLGIPDAALVGTNLGYRSTFITTLVLVASNLAMLVAAWSGRGLPTLAIIVLIGSIANGLITWLVARRSIHWWGVRKPLREDVRSIGKFSGWVLLWSFVTRILLSTEFILLGVLAGALTVTNYTFTSYISQFAVAICLMTGSAFMPKLGALVGGGEHHEAKELVHEVREATLAIGAIAGAAIILLNREFVTLWAGADRYMGDAINALMVIAMMQLILIRNDSQIQDVGLNIKSKVLVGITGSVLSLGAAILMYSFDGIAGMYIGVIVGRSVLNVVFPLLVNRMIAGANYTIRPVLVMCAILAGSYLVSPHIRVHGWVDFIAVAILCAATLCGTAYAFLVSPNTRQKLFWASRQPQGVS